jgi:hypothetical protein
LYIDGRDATSDEARALVPGILGQLHAGLKRLEADVLQDFAREQLESGNLTVVNQHWPLRNRYEYFRGQAQERMEHPNSTPSNIVARPRPPM